MADQKITALTENTTPVLTDIMPMVDDPAGTPATQKITLTTLANLFTNNSLYRQALINGNFDVWQRGTTMTSVNGITILADRWKMYTSSTNETNTFSQQDGTGVNGSRYCAKWQRANGQTGTTGFQLGQSLETQNSILFRGQYLTLSFWAKAGANYSATNGYLSCYVRTGTGTDGEIIAGFTGSATVASADNVLTTSWQKFTVTTSAVIASSVNQIGVLFNGIPVGTAGADDSLYITQVQLCAGSVALPFMPKSFDQELSDCKRYYQKSYVYATAPGTATSTGKVECSWGTASPVGTIFGGAISFPHTMRSGVTGNVYDMAGTIDKITSEDGGATTTDGRTINAVNFTDSSMNVRVYNLSGVVGILWHWVASAEL